MHCDVNDRRVRLAGSTATRWAILAHRSLRHAGEAVRVIACAIIHEPKISVLDETTRALVNESEKIVHAALNNLMARANLATLVIT